MPRPKHKRRIKLIRPGLQLRLVGSFLGLTVLAMLLQYLLLSRQLIRAAGEIEGVGGQLADRVPGMIGWVLLFSMLIVTPLILGFGVILTFRIAGPVYRFEQFLSAVARGEQTQPCKLREDDELKELCELVNAATEGERLRIAANRESAGSEASVAAVASEASVAAEAKSSAA